MALRLAVLNHIIFPHVTAFQFLVTHVASKPTMLIIIISIVYILTNISSVYIISAGVQIVSYNNVNAVGKVFGHAGW